MHDRQSEETSVIVAFLDDLMATSKIENVAHGLGYSVVFIGNTEALSSGTAGEKVFEPAEPLIGIGASLVDGVTTWQPALIIFDLANDAIPWRQWLSILKSSPATRRFPVLCFGPHVQTETLEEARNRAADAVVPRSRFMSALPALLEQFAHIPDYEAISEACLRPLSELALQGLQAFNRGEYFLAHEHLEDAWNEDESAARNVYKAILQVAIAYLQIERGNYNGAVKMFLRARHWLNPLPDICRGVDIARLKRDANDVHQTLLDLGPENMELFDRSKFQPVYFQSDYP